jgi:hypothetical protein
MPSKDPIESARSHFGESLPPGALRSPAAERNKQPILEAIAGVLPASGTVLEIASGTGQHVLHFANAHPSLSWQPSDPDPALLESIRLHRAAAIHGNVLEPLQLDVLERPWPLEHAAAIVCINMIHIAPWAATAGLFAGAAALLHAGSPLILYGPFRMDGRHTAPSNAAFDENLKARNPDWGVRDLERVTESAEQCGFSLAATTAMPANNLTVVYCRAR